jgi:L-asparaginase II
VDSPFESDPVLVEVVRNGFVESVHRGRVAITNPDGSVASAIGADFAPMYPRSANKPLQAVGMLRAGLDLDGELLALVCASHSGEPFHLDGVRRILGMSGLDESALQTPVDWPLDPQAREDAIRSGVAKSSPAMNCSGKHAGMIRTTVLNGRDVATYRDPDHPIQLAIVQAIDDLAHEQATNLAIDGCGAPLYAISLYGLARAFGRIASASDGAEHRVATAIRSHPEFVSGTRRDELELHRAIPGLMGKSGAESVYAVGLGDGRGVAIKISDGNPRGRAVVMAGVLKRLGFDHETLDAQVSCPVLGGGDQVGEIRPCKEALAELGA